MTAKKFKVISQTRVGVLSPDRQAVWAQMHARIQELELARRALEQEMASFVSILYKEYAVPQGAMCKTPELLVAPDGAIGVRYCKCPRCQAVLNDVSVADAVQAMLGNGSLTKEEVEYFREAAEFDVASALYKEKLH